MTTLTSLRQLQYLVALSEKLNFTRAAEACLVTQSTLSAGLRELEDALGIRLVERDRQTVLMTPIGTEVANRARSILAATQDLVQIATESRGPMTGLLRLGVIPTIAPFLLPRCLRLLHRRYPELHLALREDLTANLLSLLAGMPADMHRRDRVVDHLGPALQELVDGAVDHLLVAGDRVRGQHHRVVRLKLHPLVLVGGHQRERRQRLALGAGRDDHDPAPVMLVEVLDGEHIGLGHIEDVELTRDPRPGMHGAPHECDQAARMASRVGRLLAHGHRAGEILGLSVRELDALLSISEPQERRPAKDSEASAFDGEQLGRSLEAALRAALDLDRESLVRELRANWIRLGPLRFLQDCAGPLIVAVGKAWESGTLEIRHEHFASACLSDFLREAREPFDHQARATTASTSMRC